MRSVRSERKQQRTRQEKTNRKKGSIAGRSCIASLQQDPEGDKPEDVIKNHSNMCHKNLKAIYETIAMHMRIDATDFLALRDQNVRFPVPLTNARRVKLGEGKDPKDFVPGQYVKLENFEHVIVQAPNKDNYVNLWKIIWRDNINVIVSICEKYGDSAQDCYPYYPMEKGKEIKIEQWTIACQDKQSSAKGLTIYSLLMTSSDPKEVEEREADEPASGPPKPKTLQITVVHENQWPSDAKLPDDLGGWTTLIDNISQFIMAICKAETAVARKSINNFVPPVMIQSHDAIYRGAVTWVLATVLKDVERKDCFDVEELCKKITRMRPGSLPTYYSVALTFAVAYNLANIRSWTQGVDTNQRIEELYNGLKERKSVA